MPSSAARRAVPSLTTWVIMPAMSEATDAGMGRSGVVHSRSAIQQARGASVDVAPRGGRLGALAGAVEVPPSYDARADPPAPAPAGGGRRGGVFLRAMA